MKINLDNLRKFESSNSSHPITLNTVQDLILKYISGSYTASQATLIVYTLKQHGILEETDNINDPPKQQLNS
jgi:hypothetical protein